MVSSRECPCETKALVHQVIKSGPSSYLAYRWQRLECGASSQFVKKETLTKEQLESAREFDPAIREAWNAESRREFQEQRVSLGLDWESRRADRKRIYDEYIMSSKWKAVRDRVVAREDGVCQGCKIRKATQVHHLTYEHLGNELLWELVAVCESCHEHAHGLSFEDGDEESYEGGY